MSEEFKPENCPHREHDRPYFNLGFVCTPCDRYCNDAEHAPKWCPMVEE